MEGQYLGKAVNGGAVLGGGRSTEGRYYIGGQQRAVLGGRLK